MDFKEVILLLIGAIAVIWVIVTLNTFIGGNSFFAYIGTPAVFGISALILGAGFTYFVYENYAKNV